MNNSVRDDDGLIHGVRIILRTYTPRGESGISSADEKLRTDCRDCYDRVERQAERGDDTQETARDPFCA